MLIGVIERLALKKSLSEQEMFDVMCNIMSGQALDEDIENFLLRLKEKGETVDEITGAARAMRKFVRRINCSKTPLLDTCGTGGDNRGTFNISTIAAFVVAGAGVTVAKHGNRSVSSRCGSADLLESLGVNLLVEEKHIEQALDEIGIAFLFAPNFHPAMKYAMPARKRLKTRTIFNILGPLTNPAFATHQIMGVFEEALVEPICHVLANLGLSRALVIFGSDGLDEITTTSHTKACEYKDGAFKVFQISPSECGINIAQADDLKGAGVLENSQIAIDVLKGKTGPKRDIVLINAAAALYTAERASSIKEALFLAEQSIDSGRAFEKLESLSEFSKRFS